MIVYVAGPYSGNSHEEIEQNIINARKIAIELWEMGHFAVCPHLNTYHFEEDCKCDYMDYIRLDLQMLSRCDAVVLTQDYERSSGAKAEKLFAEERGMSVYVYPDVPTVHSTELKRPAQVQAFIDTIMKMYRVHLDKNADYSPANILGTGEYGLVTRTWDKMARLLNLFGFKIEIASMHFEPVQKPKCESIDDTIMDLSVYGIIWQLVRHDLWGK